MFQTNQITDAPESDSRPFEILKLTVATQVDRIINDVDVRIICVRVRGDDVLVPVLRPPCRQILPDFQRLLSRDLARFETHPDVIGDNIMPTLVTPGFLGVLLLREQKLRLRGNRVALEGGDKLAALGFTFILDIINGAPKRGGDAAGPMDGLNPRRGYGSTTPPGKLIKLDMLDTSGSCPPCPSSETLAFKGICQTHRP